MLNIMKINNIRMKINIMKNKIKNIKNIKNKKILIILILILILILFIFTPIFKYIYSFIENFDDDNNANINLPLPYDIVIVGCARNIESHLLNTKEKLNMINSLFKTSKIIIYENDSNDKTLDILKDWENEKFIQLITEKDIKGSRTERLAYARQLLYKEAMKHKFDLLIVIDLDNVINDLSKESIMSCFKLKEDWGMLGGNQTVNYYDLWALRTYDDWMPFDCLACIDYEKKSRDYCLNDRFKIINKDSEPIKVISCFGGIGIYKRQYLDNCSYGKGTQDFNGNQIEICEHVEFNKGVINNGGKIYINPKLINH
jgi:hypothetical protein